MHVGSVYDGAIIQFPNSTRYFMKVCNKNGTGGVVDIFKGTYIATSDLPSYDFRESSAIIVARNIEEFYSDFSENNS